MLRTSAIAAVAAAATMGVAAPAFAGAYTPAPAEPVVMTPAPAPVVADSDWTGGYVGLSLGYGDIDAGPANGDGMTYGVQGGYDYDFGDYVVGGELSYNEADFGLGGVDIDNTTALKVRAGYDAGSTLYYGVAGAERIDTSIGNDTGYVVGLGAEHMLTENVSLGGEYLYHDGATIGGTDIDGSTIAAKLNYRF